MHERCVELSDLRDWQYVKLSSCDFEQQLAQVSRVEHLRLLVVDDALLLALKPGVLTIRIVVQRADARVLAGANCPHL